MKKPKKWSPEWFRQFSTEELAKKIVEAVHEGDSKKKKPRKKQTKKSPK